MRNTEAPCFPTFAEDSSQSVDAVAEPSSVRIRFHCPIDQAKKKHSFLSSLISGMLVMAILPSQRTEFLGYGQSNTRSSTCDECDLLFSDSIAWSVFVSVSNLFHLCMPSISTRLPSGACFFSSMPQHWMHGVRLCPIHPRHPSLGRFVCLSHVRRVSPFTVQSTCHVSTSSWQTTCMRTSPRSTSSRNGLVIVSLCRCVRWSIQLDPGGQGRRWGGDWMAVVWKPRPTPQHWGEWVMGHNPKVKR